MTTTSRDNDEANGYLWGELRTVAAGRVEDWEAFCRSLLAAINQDRPLGAFLKNAGLGDWFDDAVARIKSPVPRLDALGASNARLTPEWLLANAIREPLRRELGVGAGDPDDVDPKDETDDSSR
jgi:hypothetical protein